MRAVQMTAFGGPEVLEPTTLPDPEAAAGELLIDVAVAEVLFLDTQLRAGWGQDYFSNVQPPFVLGGGVVGTVAAVGEGVEDDWIGKRVVAGTSAAGEYRGGGYAERVAVAASGAHVVPDAVTSEHAIAAHSDGVMGVTRVEKARLEAGQVALITAAAGSIATWLIPLLKADGVRVIGAARGDRKVAFVREHGADQAIDYGEDGWEDAIDGEVDVVFDGAGGAIGTAAFGRVRRGGKFFSYGAAAGGFADIEAAGEERGVTVFGLDDSFTPEEMHAAAGRAMEKIANGTIVPVIGQSVPLERASEAHTALAERRVTGKSVLTT